MPPRRLSDSDKQEIIELYRQPEETTSTLASRYGVSNSTISRVLKQGLSAEDYDALVQQKRTGSPPKPQTSKADTRKVDTNLAAAVRTLLEEESPDPDPSDIQADQDSAPGDASDAPSSEPSSPGKKTRRSSPTKRGESSSRRRRKRTAASSSDNSQSASKRAQDSGSSTAAEAEQPGVPTLNGSDGRTSDREPIGIPFEPSFDEPPTPSSYPSYERSNADGLTEVLDEDLLDPEDDFTDLDDDDFNDDDDLGDDDLSDGEDFLTSRQSQREDLVQIYPFADAELPRICYLVIDRSAELITCPLEDFGELGQIPSDELTAKTLPVFDNHRVAKRFANRRTQRIVKIPDGRLLRKTSPYLQAKGITRLLIDGQVFALNEP